LCGVSRWWLRRLRNVSRQWVQRLCDVRRRRPRRLRDVWSATAEPGALCGPPVVVRVLSKPAPLLLPQGNRNYQLPPNCLRRRTASFKKHHSPPHPIQKHAVLGRAVETRVEARPRRFWLTRNTNALTYAGLSLRSFWPNEALTNSPTSSIWFLAAPAR
jgi:hypothetical protein